MNKSVLLVDDEPSLLHAMVRRLGSLRRDWDIVSAPGGHAALALAAGRPFDVFITDMRMPGMHGIAFLEQIQLRHPDALRIVLSGQMDVDSQLATADVAHHSFAKPCDLRAVVDFIDGASMR